MHLGCALRECGRALVSFLRSFAVKYLLFLLLAGWLACALTGCQMTPMGQKLVNAANPWNWFAGDDAKKEQKAEAKKGSQENDIVTSAQTEFTKTGKALESAAMENPESVSIKVAQRTNFNGLSLLNQRQPLPASKMQEALDVAAGLLKQDLKAEAAQAKAEGENKKLSEALEKTNKELGELRIKSQQEAAHNLELAKELNNERLMKWGGIALSTLLGAAALAYRLNLGNLQTGVGNALGVLQKKYGGSDEDLVSMKHEIDTLIGAAQQKSIFNVASKLIAK